MPASRDRAVLDWPVAGRRLVLAFASRAGLGDRFSVLSTALRLALLHNASLLVPPPCLMLAAAHNFNDSEVCCSHRWADYLTVPEHVGLHELELSQAWLLIRWAQGGSPRVSGCSMFATSHTEASLSALASEADACVVIGTNEELHAAARFADSHQKQQQQPTSSPPPPPLLRMGTAAGIGVAKAISQRYAPFYALQWRRADKAFACNSVEAVTARLVRDSVRPLPLLILTNEVQPSRIAALRDALLQSTNLSEVVVLRDLPELRERAPDNFALYTYELEIARSAIEVVETFKKHDPFFTALCPNKSAPLEPDVSCVTLPCAYEWGARRADERSTEGACRMTGHAVGATAAYSNQCFDSLLLVPYNQPRCRGSMSRR